MDSRLLKLRREKLGLTQQQVAERAGLHQQAYARVESGERPDPRLSTAEKIADALQTSLDRLREKPKKGGQS